MEQQSSQAEAEYFGLAELWDQELYGKLKRDRLIAYVVAGVFAFLTALSVIAVMLLTPLKTVEPYMILVDKTTGYSEVVRKLNYNEASSLTEKETYVLAEINSYILARNTFDVLDVERRYTSIRMSTGADEFRRYVQELSKDTQRYSESTRRLVNVKSIVPDLANKEAQVRFSTSIEGATRSDMTQHWIATLDYDFVKLNLPMKDRYLNPLGFIVKAYRVDPEILQ